MAHFGFDIWRKMLINDNSSKGGAWCWSGARSGGRAGGLPFYGAGAGAVLVGAAAGARGVAVQGLVLRVGWCWAAGGLLLCLVGLPSMVLVLVLASLVRVMLLLRFCGFASRGWWLGAGGAGAAAGAAGGWPFYGINAAFFDENHPGQEDKRIEAMHVKTVCSRQVVAWDMHSPHGTKAHVTDFLPYTNKTFQNLSMPNRTFVAYNFLSF
eukprot:gene21488-28464_t